MRGRKQAQRQCVAMIDVNARIPQGHPIREVKRVSDEVFGRLSERFEAIYSDIGRPSIPPERLLGARLLMALLGDSGPKDSNGWGDFSGQSRSNEAHESTSDPEAKLIKSGKWLNLGASKAEKSCQKCPC
jgi:hypothetical protein